MLKDTLLAYRRAHGLKQEALAHRLGVSQATVSRWERGAGHPTLGQRRRIADVMRVEGLCPSIEALAAMQTDPNPCNLTIGEDWIWIASNAAARAGHHAHSLRYLGQSALRYIHPIRVAMFDDARAGVVRREIVGAECLNPWLGPHGRLDPIAEPAFLNHTFSSFSFFDGRLHIFTRGRLLTMEEAARRCLSPGSRLTTLDDVLRGADAP